MLNPIEVYGTISDTIVIKTDDEQGKTQAKLFDLIGHVVLVHGAQVRDGVLWIMFAPAEVTG